jgi:cytochrome c-type biogenesis protein CcmF
LNAGELVSGQDTILPGKDVMVTGAGDNPDAVAETISSVSGLTVQEAQFLLAELPFPAVTCTGDDNALRVKELLEVDGATVTLAPPHECAFQTALIPPNSTVPSPTRLAETSNGLNPLLRHFGMIIHPPMLYLGFVGFVIPYSFAMAALASGDLSTNWIKATRRWALVAWLFLALGLILGGRWAYDVLGWRLLGLGPGGKRRLPVLVGGHGLPAQRHDPGKARDVQSVEHVPRYSGVLCGDLRHVCHAQRPDRQRTQLRAERDRLPDVRLWAGMTLSVGRPDFMALNRGELRDEHGFTSLFSRETLFVLNNAIFVLLTGAIFWGSFGAPIISELFMDTNITLGTDYFMQVTPPLFIVLYILMGVAPLSAWGAASLRRLGRALLVPFALSAILTTFLITTGTPVMTAALGYGVVSFAGFVALYEIYRGASARRKSVGEDWLRAALALFGRNRRRYGGYVIHIGITVIGIGAIASTLFQQQTQRTLALGQSLDFSGYTLTYGNFTEAIAEDGRRMDIADVTVSRGGQALANLRPRLDQYYNADGTPGQTMTIAGQHSTLENDFYVLLVGWEPVSNNSATFKIYINPLINLVWGGGIILILGTLVAAWPNEMAPIYATEHKRGDRRARAKA